MVLPLRCEDVDDETFEVRRTAHEGRILRGRGRPTAASPTACASSRPRATLARVLVAQINLNGPDRQLLFPTPRSCL